MSKQYEAQATEILVGGIEIQAPAPTAQAYRVIEVGEPVITSPADIRAEKERQRAERRTVDIMERLGQQIGRKGRHFNFDEIADPSPFWKNRISE